MAVDRWAIQTTRENKNNQLKGNENKMRCRAAANVIFKPSCLFDSNLEAKLKVPERKIAQTKVIN